MSHLHKYSWFYNDLTMFSGHSFQIWPVCNTWGPFSGRADGPFWPSISCPWSRPECFCGVPPAPAYAQTTSLSGRHRYSAGSGISIRACLESPMRVDWGGQMVGCKDADPKHIPEYVEDRGRRRRPFAAPRRSRRSFQTGS